MTLPQPVADLVDRFHRNRDAYLSGQYNETQVRREFIDPMFESLGWDINNRQGYAEAYKDVIHEDAIKIGGATKALPVFRTTAENGRLHVSASAARENSSSKPRNRPSKSATMSAPTANYADTLSVNRGGARQQRC